MEMRPTQSNCSNSLRSGWSKSMSVIAAMVTMMPGTMLMKNSQCQENASVRIPPTVGPMVGASVATSPMSGVITIMRERGKMV